jgi:DNA-binding response OmpR family regulator
MKTLEQSVMCDRWSDASLDSQLAKQPGDMPTVFASAIAPIITSQRDGFQRERVVRKWPRVALDGYAAVPVVAAEASSRRYIARVLEKVGYKVTGFVEPRAALDALAQHRYDVAVLSGCQERLEWCSAVHEVRPEVPVLFVLEGGGPKSVARVIDAGADDFLEAPFFECDLNARVWLMFRHVWRRHGMAVQGGGGFRLDPARPRARVDGREITLTAPEYRTLWMLAQAEGAVLPFWCIEQSVWGDSTPSHRSELRRVIRSLRRKLSNRSGEPLRLNELSVGYQLRLPRIGAASAAQSRLPRVASATYDQRSPAPIPSSQPGTRPWLPVDLAR